MSSQSIREFFEQYELNVHPDAIMNPPNDQGQKTNHKAYGINVMRQMLEIGTLHVNENCQEFLREAQNYFVDEKGRFSDPDDAIDSARYALLGCLNGLAEPWDGRSPQQRMRDYRHQYQAVKQQKQNSLPEWKQAFDPSGR